MIDYLMISVKDEQHIKSLLNDRIRPVVGLIQMIDQVQERGRVAQSMRRLVEGPSHANAVGHRSDGGRLSDQTEDLLVHHLERGGCGLGVEVLTLEGGIGIGGEGSEGGEPSG